MGESINSIIQIKIVDKYKMFDVYRNNAYIHVQSAHTHNYLSKSVGRLMSFSGVAFFAESWVM